MSFQDRAIEVCLRDFLSGTVVETHVRDVLKCRNIDVDSFVEFLGVDYPSEVRWASARILAVQGKSKEVIKAALNSEERGDIVNFLSILGKQNVGLEELENLLSSQDTMVRDAAIDMFRKAGNSDVLFPLIFDRDDAVVQRIKRYINETGQCRQTRSS